MRYLSLFAASVAFLSVSPVLAQDDDRGRLTRFIEDQLSDGADRQVRIEGFEGALSSEATLERLVISDADGEWLILEDAQLNWRRAALLTGALRITALTAERLSVLRAPLPPEGPDLPSPEATPFALPDLPVSIEIGEIAIGRLELGESLLGQEAALSITGAAELDGGSGSVDVVAERLDGPEGRFAIDASFVNDTRVLDLDVGLREAPGGLAATLLNVPGTPEVALTVAGQGPLDDIEVDIALATDGVDRVDGSVRSARLGDDGAQQIDVDIAGDLTPLMAEEYRTFFGSDSRLAAEVRLLADGATELTGLDLSGAAFDVDGDVSLDAAGRPSRFEISARIANPEGDGPVRLPVAGDTELGRALLDLSYDAEAGEEYRLDAILSDLLVADTRVASASITANGRIVPDATGVGSVTSTIAATLSGLAPTDPALATAVGETAVLGAEVDWSAGAPLVVENLSVRGAGLNADGRITAGLGGMQLPLTFDLTADVETIGRFSGLAGQELGGAVDATLRGTAEALSGAFDIALEGQARDLSVGDLLPPGALAGDSTVQLVAARDAEGTRIDRISLEAAGISVQGQASVGSGGESLPLEFDLAADVEDIARFSALAGQDLAGALDAAVRGSADAEARTFDVAFVGQTRDLAVGDILPAGVLPGETELRIDAVGDGQIARVDGFTLNADGLSLGGSFSAGYGSDDLPLTFDLDADVEDIARFSALAGQDLAGGVDAEISGTANVASRTFDIAFAGQASDLRVGELLPPEVLAGESALIIDALGDGDTARVDRFSLDAAGVTAAGSFSVGYGGEDLPLTFDIDADVADISRFAALAGQNLAGAIDASLTGSAEIRAGDFDVSLIGETRDLRVSDALPPALLAGRTDLRVDAVRAGEDIRVDTLTIDGREIDLSAEGNLGPGGTGLTATARLADVGLFTTAVRGPVSVSAEVDRAADGWAIDAGLQGPAGLSAAVDGRVGLPGGAVDLGATGTVPLVLANRFIAPQSVSGPLAFDVTVRGVPALEAVSGRLSTIGARLAVPAAQLALTDIALSADLAGGRIAIDGGGNVSTGGRVGLNGTLDLGAPRLPADIAVTLDSVRLIDPTLYEVVIARGDLTASGPLAGGLRVAGDIRLAPSELRVPEAGLGSAAPIPDIVHAGETAAERQTRAAAGLIARFGGASEAGPAVGLDVTIAAPAQIFLRGRGIDAEFGGTIRIGGTTQNIIPSGRFELLRGRLSILGTRLDFTEGSATLQGDFDPFLNLRAESPAGSYRVFIEVRGPASAPEITFSSDPFLPEDEILAQLLFGRSTSALSPLQLLQLADAATSLAGGGSDRGILSGLRDGLGLDDLDIQTDAEGNAAVRAGRYLSENIYTDVTIGAGGESDLSLNIDLTPDITARGSVSSDGGSSLGVFFERDY